MSVAENRVTERAPHRPHQQLAVGSLLGGLYALASLAIVFAGLPYVWTEVLQVQHHTNEFLSTALLVLVALGAAVGLGYVGYRLLQGSHEPGLRAGIFFAAVMIFAALWITVAVGGSLEAGDVVTGPGGFVVLGLILAGLLGGAAYLFMTPGFTGFLETVDAQGWFSGSGYKANQGVRVRRGTVLAILAVGASGIITLATHRVFGMERLGANDWSWVVPFTSENMGPYTEMRYVPLMYKVHLLMPILLGGLLLWFAWRVVNLPTFADFLIATEAEMNKVSWTSRRRLFQDTIVVLVTVFLFTAFLFSIDILWVKVLSNRYVGVLMVDMKAEQQKMNEKTQW